MGGSIGLSSGKGPKRGSELIDCVPRAVGCEYSFKRSSDDAVVERGGVEAVGRPRRFRAVSDLLGDSHDTWEGPA
jgi:hypothetical protein